MDGAGADEACMNGAHHHIFLYCLIQLRHTAEHDTKKLAIKTKYELVS